MAVKEQKPNQIKPQYIQIHKLKKTNKVASISLALK